MWGFTTVAGAFAAAFFVVALFWGGAGIVVALPIALIVLAAGFLIDLRKRGREARSARDIRERARRHEVHFTERDEQTLVRK
jgi:hypothetical protein